MISRRLLMAAAASATLPITASANTGLRWEKRPGKAFQIAVGAQGQVWCLGADSVPGGFPVFKWEGNAWKKVPGGLVSLAVDAQGQPWGTNEAKAIFRMQGGKWTTLPGRAEQVAIGGQGTVYALGARGNNDVDTAVYEWGSNAWNKIAGATGSRLAVDEEDMPWLLQGGGEILRGRRSSWEKVPGRAQDIAVGAKGGVWVIGHDERGKGGFGIHRFDGRGWQRVDGAALNLAVAPNGLPWVINQSGEIFQRV